MNFVLLVVSDVILTTLGTEEVKPNLLTVRSRIDGGYEVFVL